MKEIDRVKWELSGSSSGESLLSVKIIRRERTGGSFVYSERWYQRTGRAAEEWVREALGMEEGSP